MGTAVPKSYLPKEEEWGADAPQALAAAPHRT
jgi:hypothetical protein